MIRLQGIDRPIYVIAVPLMLSVTLLLTWLVPFTAPTRVIITLMLLAGATYTGLSYWLLTRKHWRGLRFTTPLVVVTLITVGLRFIGAQTPLAFLIYFPAVILSSIRSGRNLGILTALLAALGYILTIALQPATTYMPYEVTFVTANLLIVAVLSGAMADEERRLRQAAQTRRVREQASLLQLADALADAADLEATVKAAVEVAAQILSVDAVSIWMPEGDRFLVLGGWGLMAPYAGRDFPFDSATLVAATMTRARSLDVSNLLQDNHFRPYPPEREQKLRGALAVPMLREGRARAAFMIYTAQPRSFSGDEAHLLSLIANQTLAAILRTRAEQETQHQAARAQALVRTAARLNMQLDLHMLLDAVCEETARALNVPIVTVRLYDGKRDALVLSAAFGVPPEWQARLPPLPRASNDIRLEPLRLGVRVVPDVQALRHLPEAEVYKELNWRTSATVSMVRERTLIGQLNIGTVGQLRQLTDDELSLLQGLSDQAAQAIANARLYEQTGQRLKQVETLRTIDMAITASLDLHLTLSVILNQVTQQLGVDAAAVLLLNPHTQMLEYAAGHGFRSRAIQETRQRVGEGHAGRAALERRMIRVANISEAESLFLHTSLVASEGFVAYFATPLVARAQVKAVLEIFHRAPLDPDADWLDFLETLAGQAAIAIDNAELFNNLQRSNIELTQAYDTTLEGWSRALDLRDKETQGHTERVAELALQLGRAVGLGEEDLVHLRRGALLHDIGKMGIPDSILLKPDVLTAQEWRVMRFHPLYAYEMLAPISHLRASLDVPYCHHEWWDGTGYPRGLSGEQIPLAARIFAIVDCWDALSSNRPYRNAWEAEQVRAYIRAQAGKQFDPQIVVTFLKMVGDSPPLR